MPLLTRELLRRLPRFFSQWSVADPIAVASFHDLGGSTTWYLIEGECATAEEEDCSDYRLRCYVVGEPTGWRSVLLSNLVADGILSEETFHEQPLSRALGCPWREHLRMLRGDDP